MLRLRHLRGHERLQLSPLPETPKIPTRPGERRRQDEAR